MFSVLAEELGVVGSLLTVALFVFVCVRGMYIGLWAERAKQYFAAYMAYGLSFLWIGQFLINIGVNVGLLPTGAVSLLQRTFRLGTRRQGRVPQRPVPASPHPAQPPACHWTTHTPQAA